MRATRMQGMLIAVWLTLGGSGCTTWRVESVPPRELLQDRSIEAVRITSTDTLVPLMEIWDPAIAGDSITGHPSKLAVARVYVPLSKVKTIATQQKSVGKTTLAVLAVAGAVAAYALIQSLNTVY
jgi:hypothetical protein